MITAERARQLLAAVGTVAPAAAPITVQVEPDRWLEAARAAKESAGCAFFNFLTAIDWKEQGLEVVVWLDNLDANLSVQLRTRLGAGRSTVASLVPLYGGANWMERECYDMFGVVFEGHPDLRRILMPEGFASYPLRKDYPLRGRLERHNFPAIPRAEG